MKTGNIFSLTPEKLPLELSETLAGFPGGARIERIVSEGHASPENFWYDQEENEWVMVLQGSAALRFEEKEDLLLLEPGDWVDIPAHVRHRVEWTDGKQKTLWLAVFY